MHRLVKLDAHRRVLVIQQEENLRAFLFPHAHLHGVRHLEQRMQIAHLAQPGDEIVVKMLVALRADIYRLAQAVGIHRHGRAAGHRSAC